MTVLFCGINTKTKKKKLFESIGYPPKDFGE
jgi:hypothetical protein